MIAPARRASPPSSDTPASLSSRCGAAQAEPIRHIYVHIPFCARICPYCAFYKELLDRRNAHSLCQAVLSELADCAAVLPIVPHTIFVGGGTPTALNLAQLTSLLRGIAQQLDLSSLSEWTIEANPGSVSPRKAALLKQAGVNRISLGVQSWDDDLLASLGREHNAHQAAHSFEILRNAGFSNINLDLMFGLPGQTVEQWEKTLAATIELWPEHISTYCLTYEEDTEFFRRYTRGELRSDPDGEAELFEITMSTLQSAGYHHYETSNYAKHGYASRHNRAYWAGADYLGLGPSAFSTMALRRWQNISNYREYVERIARRQSAINAIEELSPEMKRTEKIALGLRTDQGVPTGLLFDQSNAVEDFVRLGLVRQCNGNIVLTNDGMRVADSIAEALI